MTVLAFFWKMFKPFLVAFFLVFKGWQHYLELWRSQGWLLWGNSKAWKNYSSVVDSTLDLNSALAIFLQFANYSVSQLFDWLAHNLFHLVIVVVVVGTHLSLWKLSKWQLLLLQCQQKRRLLSPLSLTLTRSLSLSLLVGQFFFIYGCSLFMFLFIFY